MTKPERLTPQSCPLIVIDHQPQMALGAQSIARHPEWADVVRT